MSNEQINQAIELRKSGKSPEEISVILNIKLAHLLYSLRTKDRERTVICPRCGNEFITPHKYKKICTHCAHTRKYIPKVEERINKVINCKYFGGIEIIDNIMGLVMNGDIYRNISSDDCGPIKEIFVPK